MTAATAYCTSNSIIYQVQLVTSRSPLTPILRLTALSSPSPSIISISSHADQQTKTKQIVSNNKQFRIIATANRHQPLNIIDNDCDHSREILPEEEFLACVGLRRKTTPRTVTKKPLKPLTKRLAVPICLLPLQSNSDRVRQALYIVLPYLKFLSITRDYDNFCPTDSNATIESLSSCSATKTRSSSSKVHKRIKSLKLSREEFLTLVANSVCNNLKETSMNRYVDAALHCQVYLDRLDEIAIDELMKIPVDDNTKNLVSVPNRKHSRQNSSSSSTIVAPAKNRNAIREMLTKTTTTHTTITTLTTEQTTVKHKLSQSNSINSPKRMKTSNKDFVTVPEKKPSPSTYERIYLKCFICCKREYIDAQVTTSDTLHSHWLKHGNDLSLNIYDSEIDSILTRVVEFFHFPKRHAFEGKVQTVFILNSEEVRKTRAAPVSDDVCIVLD